MRNSPGAAGTHTDYDYEYRVDTEVITVTLHAALINPDGPAIKDLTIKGSTYRMRNIAIPRGTVSPG
ncbi:MAG: hypothetical protein ACLRWQ_14190 [Flavonifractor plautii]